MMRNLLALALYTPLNLLFWLVVAIVLSALCEYIGGLVFFSRYVETGTGNKPGLRRVFGIIVLVAAVLLMCRLALV